MVSDSKLSTTKRELRKQLRRMSAGYDPALLPGLLEKLKEVDFLFGNEDFGHGDWLRRLHPLDQALPPEFILGFKKLGVQSILDIGCGSGWVSDCLSKDVFYCGFDNDAPGYDNPRYIDVVAESKIVASIENVAANPSLITSKGRSKFDVFFTKGVLMLTLHLRNEWEALFKHFNPKYFFLYETVQGGKWDWHPWFEEKFKLLFSNKRPPSITEIWRRRRRRSGFA